MLRRSLWVLLAALLLAPLAAAQNTTTVNGTIVDPNGLPYSNATIQAQLIPSGVTPTVPPPCNGQNSTPCAVSAFSQANANAAGTFSMNLASNAVLSPAGTQWQFTVSESPGVPLPMGTGPQSFTATLTISGASQSILSNLNAVAPALVRSAGTPVVLNVKQAPYGALGDTQQVVDATMASGSPNLTSATRNCNSANDPGKFAQVAIGSGGSGGQPETTPSVTTISSCSGNTFVLAVPANDANCAGGGCIFTYGHDDNPSPTGPLQTALNTAQNPSGFSTLQTGQQAQVYFPCGGYLIGKTLTNVNINVGAPDSLVGSPGCVTIYTRADITGYGAAIAATLGGGGNRIQDLNFNGGGFFYNSFAPFDFVNISCSSCVVEHVFSFHVGYSSGGASGAALSISNPSYGGHITVIHAGAVAGTNNSFQSMSGCEIGNGGVDWYDPFCSNGWGTGTSANFVFNNVNSTDSQGAGDGTAVYGGLIDEGNPGMLLVNSKNVHVFGTRTFSNTAAGFAISVDGTSSLHLVDGNVGPFCVTCATSTGNGLQILLGGVVWASDTVFRSFSTGTAISNSGSLFDLGGNRMIGGGTTLTGNAPIFPLLPNATTQLGGSQVVNGAVPTGCTITGNGTSTCTFDTGSTNAAGRITITAAGTTTAVGLVSFTFSATLGTNSSNCSANYLNGTGTWAIGAVAPIFVTNTTAGVSFNINNAGTNLTATSTYKVNYTCYGQ